MSSVAEHEEGLQLRGKVAPVRRFSKTALIMVIGAGALVVLGSLAFALRAPPEREGGVPQELYNTQNKAKADQLASLPARYDQVKHAPPELGPKLPGDLGAPILAAQRAVQVPAEPWEPRSFGNDGQALTDAQAAAKVEAETRERAARESDLFFEVGHRTSSVSVAAPRPIERRAQYAPDLSALAQLGGAGQQADPGGQIRKQGFISAGAGRSSAEAVRLERPASPFQLMAGSIIPATLLTGVNSDLPGDVIAQVTEPVYDTATGDHLLIPQGSRLIGHYDSVISYGQTRALLIWTRLIRPDGSSIQLGNLAGTDAQGFAGLQDRVDHHAGRLAAGIVLSTLLSVGGELARDDGDDVRTVIIDGAQREVDDIGRDVVRRQLDVPPTITIRSGWRLRIIVNRDIVFEG